jgi:hypothetical protein
MKPAADNISASAMLRGSCMEYLGELIGVLHLSSVPLAMLHSLLGHQLTCSKCYWPRPPFHHQQHGFSQEYVEHGKLRLLLECETPFYITVDHLTCSKCYGTLTPSTNNLTGYPDGHFDRVQSKEHASTVCDTALGTARRSRKSYYLDGRMWYIYAHRSHWASAFPAGQPVEVISYAVLVFVSTYLPPSNRRNTV